MEFTTLRSPAELIAEARLRAAYFDSGGTITRFPLGHRGLETVWLPKMRSGNRGAFVTRPYTGDNETKEEISQGNTTQRS